MLKEKEARADSPLAETHETSLWQNRHFNIFWCGQTLSALGDAFEFVALPLLVLQTTGSIVAMGLITSVVGIGQFLMGLFAGILVDRFDRRLLMLWCDTIRTLLYLSLPVCWWLLGPQLWLIFLIAALGSCLGAIFEVAYVAAIPQLVEKDQIADANGRTQTTFAIAFVVGPILAGVIAGGLGAALAIGLDGLTFALSAISILLLRLRTRSDPAIDQQTQTVKQEFLAGFTFLWNNSILRALTIFMALLMLLTAGALDLFTFHLKHDLLLNDNAVGIVFGLASVGAIPASLLASFLYKHLGFAACWIGGFLLSCLAITLIGLASNIFTISVLTISFAFCNTLVTTTALSLRQQIVPEHIIGRVTSAFWTITAAPGPLGATLLTLLAGRIGIHAVSLLIGTCSILIILTSLVTPLRQKYPEHDPLLITLPVLEPEPQLAYSSRPLITELPTMKWQILSRSVISEIPTMKLQPITISLISEFPTMKMRPIKTPNSLKKITFVRATLRKDERGASMD
jgi:MFS family permease